MIGFRIWLKRLWLTLLLLGAGLLLLGILLQWRQRRPLQTRPRPSSGGFSGGRCPADPYGAAMVPQALTVGQYSEVGHSVKVSAAAGRTVVRRVTLDENTPRNTYSANATTRVMVVGG